MMSQLSSRLDIGSRLDAERLHCESFKSFSNCICENFFPRIQFFKKSIFINEIDGTPRDSFAQYLLSSVRRTSGASADAPN